MVASTHERMPTSPIDVTVSLFKGIRPAVVGVWNHTWAEFVEHALPALLDEVRSDKKRLPGFVLAAVANGRRVDDNCDAHTALAIDVDALPDNDLGALQKRAARLRCAVYETASSTDEAPRVRVIAALRGRIQPEHVPAQRLAFARALGLDPDACGTAGALPTSQVMFCGRVEGTRERGLWVYEGRVWAPPSVRVSGLRKIQTVDRDTAGRTPALPRAPSAFAFDSPPDLSALARLVPPPGVDGDRHLLVRSLGGWLARRGHSPASIAEAVREQIPSDSPAERAAQAQDAAERVLAGEDAPGWQSLSAWVERFAGEDGASPKKVLRGLTKACRDPREPEGFGEVWSEQWARDWPATASFWKRRNATARAANARTHRAAPAPAPAPAPREPNTGGAAPDFECDDDGQPYSHAANVQVGVTWYMSHALARDASTGRIHIRERVTLQGPAGTDDVFELGMWTDVHTSRLHAALCRLGLRRPGRSDVDNFAAELASKRMVWPVREYLEGLPAWDGEARSLCTYFGVARGTYTDWVCAAWLRSCVARGMVPGCQVDHVLVLEGPQGNAKSSALRLLAGDEWFGQFSANVKDDKKVGEQLQGKWIVEIAELDKWTRTHSEADLKDVLTRREDDYRGAYDRHAERRKRVAVASASTNRSEYLTDDTGNRRYWPIVTGVFDLAGLARDRAQVWAQALAEYRTHIETWAPGVETGGEWWPATDEIKALVRAEQGKRLVGDAWDKAVAKWSADQTRTFRAEDAARFAVGLELERIDARAIGRVERCLLACGCVRTQTKRGTRVWRKADV